MNAFTVLTEFRFDIASAVANSQTLQTEVGKISSAADQAHFSLQRIGMGLVAQMGLGGGGVLGVLYKAITASDKFYQSQLKLSNIMLSNNMFTGENAFEQSMLASKRALESMSKTAKEFSLPSDVFANMTMGIGAALSVKGLDDASMGKSIDLTRQFLKSAPVLGIDPGMYQQNLLDMVMGQGSIGDRLTQRLMAETSAMQPFQGSMKGFNALPAAKRLEVLTQALAQFSSNAKINHAIVMSLSGQMRLLTDQLTSVFSIFRHFGDMLNKHIVGILSVVNTYIKDNGEKIVKNFTRIFNALIESPEKLFLGIQQARQLQGDVRSAGQIIFITGMIHAVTGALRFLGFTLSGGLIMTGLRTLISGLSTFFTWLMSFGGLTIILKGLSWALMAVIAPLMIWTFIMQTISRAIAKAQIINAKWFATNMAKITEVFAKFAEAFKLIMLPITLAMEGLSDMIAWVIASPMVFNFLLSSFEKIATVFTAVGNVVLGVLSFIAGMTNMLMGQVFNIMQGNFRSLFKSDEWLGLFKEGFDDFFMKYKQKDISVDDSQVSTKVTNIDKIEINNQFKEQMEPDRIAFMLKEQLVKTATNPTGSSGRSLQGALVGR